MGFQIVQGVRGDWFAFPQTISASWNTANGKHMVSEGISEASRWKQLTSMGFKKDDERRTEQK